MSSLVQTARRTWRYVTLYRRFILFNHWARSSLFRGTSTCAASTTVLQSSSTMYGSHHLGRV